MATKLGFPGVGNACVDSIAAKEKIRFNFRDDREISGEFRKILNSLGRGGRGWMAENRLPFGPQQNPGFSPVRSVMPHVPHRLSAARLFEDEPHASRCVNMGAMIQLSDMAGW